VGHLYHLLYGRNRAQRVGYVRKRNKFGAGAQQLLVLVQQDLSAVIDRNDAQPRSLLRRQHLPWNDIGVVLDPANDDFVFLPDVLSSPTLCHQIDGLGCTTHEDDLFGRRRVEEVRDLGASIFVGVGGAGGQIVCSTVNVGVLVLVEIPEAVDDGLRLLRGGCVVEPDQWAAINLLVQDRKVAANASDVELAIDQRKIRQMSRREALCWLRSRCDGMRCRNDGLRERTRSFEKIERQRGIQYSLSVVLRAQCCEWGDSRQRGFEVRKGKIEVGQRKIER